MTLADYSMAAFALLNGGRIVAYMPQIMCVYRDRNGAGAVSLLPGFGDAGEAVCEVMRGCLTLDRRIQREDQFLVWSQPDKKPLDVEIVRADPVQRRQCSTQHMIASSKSAGSFERPEIGEVFDDANRCRIPLRVAADRAGFDRV